MRKAGTVTSTMREAAHPPECAGRGAGAGRAAIKYQSLCRQEVMRPLSLCPGQKLAPVPLALRRGSNRGCGFSHFRLGRVEFDCWQQIKIHKTLSWRREVTSTSMRDAARYVSLGSYSGPTGVPRS